MVSVSHGVTGVKKSQEALDLTAPMAKVRGKPHSVVELSGWGCLLFCLFYLESYVVDLLSLRLDCCGCGNSDLCEEFVLSIGAHQDQKSNPGSHGC